METSSAENWTVCCYQSGSWRGPEPCKEQGNKGLMWGLDLHKGGKPGCRVKKGVWRTRGDIVSSYDTLGRAYKSILEGSWNKNAQ